MKDFRGSSPKCYVEQRDSRAFRSQAAERTPKKNQPEEEAVLIPPQTPIR